MARRAGVGGVGIRHAAMQGDATGQADEPDRGHKELVSVRFFAHEHVEDEAAAETGSMSVGSDDHAHALATYGKNLGLAFQIIDDVLDEVNQLYFERRRVLAELSIAPPGERLRLGIRAAELAAGIDAWTGGWFSRAHAGRL